MKICIMKDALRIWKNLTVRNNWLFDTKNLKYPPFFISIFFISVVCVCVSVCVCVCVNLAKSWKFISLTFWVFIIGELNFISIKLSCVLDNNTLHIVTRAKHWFFGTKIHIFVDIIYLVLFFRNKSCFSLFSNIFRCMV